MKHVLLLSVLVFLMSFPGQGQQTIGLFQNDTASFNGYTLFAPTTFNKTYLIDNCGEVVHEWTSNYFPGMDVQLLENGNLLRAGRWNGSFNGGGVGGRIELYNWEGELLWGFIYATEEYHQHHDVEMLPNGNVLILAWEDRTDAEAIQAGRNPASIGQNGVWPERIVEVEPFGINQGTVVWEWRVWDHLVQDFDPDKDNFGAIADHPERIDVNFAVGNGSADWLHANSIDYVEELDVIILNSRDFEEFWVIDHSTTLLESAGQTGGNFGKGGDILYRWGNPRAYDRGGPDDKKLFKQHFPHWVEEGPLAGKIILYNNGNGRPEGTYSSVDILEPPLDADGNFILEADQPYGPDSLFWTYGNNDDQFFFSPNMSGAWPLPNGNVLICVGASGIFIEVTPEMEEVWRYVNPISNGGPDVQGEPAGNNGSFRAYRYSVDYPAFAGRDLTPMGPLELEPLPSTCMITEEPMTVFTTEAILAQEIRLLGNPVRNELAVQNHYGHHLEVTLLDLTGRIHRSFQTSDQFITSDLSFLPGGMYILRFRDLKTNEVFIQKIIKA